MVICRARGDWIPSWSLQILHPKNPRWAPTVTWSYLDALHRNVGEISEFQATLGLTLPKKSMWEKVGLWLGWVLYHLFDAVWICMTCMAALRLMRHDAIFPIVKSCVFVWSWFLFSNEQGGSFSAFTLRIPSPSFLVALSGSGSVSLWRCPKRSENQCYQDLWGLCW